MKILMVCRGNICRSPLAEGILRDKAKKAGLNWIVDSAGTYGYNPGCPPHNYSERIARKYGIDICDQKCRSLTKDDIIIFDKVYVMDDDNYYDVKRISGKNWNASKVDFIMNELYPASDLIVPDPWTGAIDDFDEVFQMLNEACDAIVKKYAVEKAML
jgi:protein-tyrosine phosphatase